MAASAEPSRTGNNLLYGPTATLGLVEYEHVDTRRQLSLNVMMS